VDNPSNLLALVAVRRRVASFDNQSHFVSENFETLRDAATKAKLAAPVAQQRKVLIPIKGHTKPRTVRQMKEEVGVVRYSKDGKKI
jgi:hypothetical protein